MTVRSRFLEVCRRTGMTTWFGNPGSTELRMFRDWPDDFRYVLALQESSAVGVAAGYAIATGRAALVSLHSAGGVGHSLGAVFDAYRDRVPLVIVAGQQTRSMLPAHPFLSAAEPATFPRPYVKWSQQPETPGAVPGALAEAHRVALTPPYGPVFLSVPEDDWDAPADPVPPRTVHAIFGADPMALREIAAALDGAVSPAIVVGSGVDEDGAWTEVTALAERLRAAVWTAPRASRAAFPEDHPLFQGHLPPLRSAIAERLRGYDVVLVLGAPVFTYHSFSDGPLLADHTRLFHVDCDPAVIAWAVTGTSVLSTIRAATAGLLALVTDVDRSPPAAWSRPAAPPLGDPLDAAAVMAALHAARPADAVIVEEAPSHKDTLHEHLPITRPGGYVTTGGGALGWGLPAAVGHALTGGRVICVVGDGSSLYSIQSLWTAARHGARVTVIVLDNRAYAAVSELGRRIGIPKIPGTDLGALDFVALATGFGCAASRVSRAADLPAALARALTHDGPYLLEIPVPPPRDQGVPQVVRATSGTP
ncbi:benzoylformate decarboxylase [Phytohabitans aurantiacus]|uniref:Benzoylformate decarboxylase n=1 Tax=Phytohabitans aurantiacus TaxID=3016789 RepID=A0ABQ5QX91_9ACTN|nr:benzoylformate decarboxylase [Phytohabitans aurantiacus]GLH98915.1 benzoylformate decarboxylase [Phytohabitans aurantiacus]